MHTSKNIKSDKINIPMAIVDAGKGFTHWWLPLCFVSSIILFSQSWLPHFLLRTFTEVKLVYPYLKIFKVFERNVLSINNSYSAFAKLKLSFYQLSSNPVVSRNLHIFLFKAIILFFFVAVLLCLLYVITIILSKASVWKTKKEAEFKRSLNRSPFLSLSYLFLSAMKGAMFVVPIVIPIGYLILRIHFSSLNLHPNYKFEIGLFHIIEFVSVLLVAIVSLVAAIYVYIRLCFTGFIITEKTADPFFAIKTSWALTESHFLNLFYIFVLTAVIDILCIISIIGFIPGTGFKYALVASAYQQVLELS